MNARCKVDWMIKKEKKITNSISSIKKTNHWRWKNHYSLININKNRILTKTHYSSSKILKRGVRFLPVLFIFIELSPIPMFIAGHDNERNQTEKQRDPSQSQRPSLDQVLPLPPPQDSADSAVARRREVALTRRRRRHRRSLNVYLRRITVEIWHLIIVSDSDLNELK